MKRVLFLAFVLFSLVSVLHADDKKKPVASKPKPKTAVKKDTVAKTATPTPAPAPAPIMGEGIHWLSINELQEKMRERPKKVFIDVYTGWCGWCKKMEATTFTNKALIKYINNNFYAVRFDAETRENIMFNGKEYHFEPQYKANTLAVEWLKGQMGYPCSIFMMENFQNPTPIPGYHSVKEMESFLLFFGDNICMHKSYNDYQKTFVSSWDNGTTEAAPQPPMVH